jgi:lycopene cyclase domain-containing protein
VTHAGYLVALLGALTCMGLIDRRWRLVLWTDPRRGGVVLAVGVVFFLAWDVLAVSFGFYRPGDSGLMIGARIAPGVPLEELFFVGFLCYVTTILHRLVDRLSSSGRTRP